MSTPNFVPPFKMLVDGVATYFASNDVAATVDRGWKKRAEQLNQGAARGNRVIFVPSKGVVVDPNKVGSRQLIESPDTDASWTVRPLSDWKRTFQVSIWGFDPTQKNDEGAQDDACWQLFTWTQRAVQSIGFGNAVWGATSFTEPVDRAVGLELLADLTIQTMIPDLPLDLTRPGAVVNKDPES